MILRDVGPAGPGFHVLGWAQVPSYLLDAPRPALFDAGLACLGRAYARDARAVLRDRPPAYLFLTHVHFDHCGAAAVLKQTFPGLTIAASARAAAILARPNALALMARLNQEGRARFANQRPELIGPEAFEPFAVDLVLADGQEIDLGDGTTLQVLATPGHTWDFLSYWIPERGVLVASEAVGCTDHTGYIVTEFLVDFETYLASVRRLLQLPARVLCQGHTEVFTGPDVRPRLERTLTAALEFREWVERLLDEEQGDEERVAMRVKAGEYDRRPQPKQPEPAYLLNLRARVAHLAGLRRQRLAGA
jgi:glyoxylase-like metal-dependent hydrolase (beta-lactamase superfamily II)